MFLAMAGSCFAVERFEINSGTNPDYLPYYLDSLEATELGITEFPLEYTLLPLTVIDSSRSPLLSIIRARNPRPGSSDRSRFSTFSHIPYLKIDNEYPVPYTITSWQPYSEFSKNRQVVVSAGRTSDAIFIGTLVLEKDSVHKNGIRLMPRDSDIAIDNWRPKATIFRIADYDLDGHREMFVYVSDNPKPRRLFCIDLVTLETEWELEIASPILSIELVIDSSDARVVLNTFSPNNGAADINFNDRFKYNLVLNNRGQIISKRITGIYSQEENRLCAAPEPEMFYLTHYTYSVDSMSIPSQINPDHHISLIDSDGQIRKSVTFNGIATQISIVPFGENALPHVWVRSRVGSVMIYSLNLDEIAYCEKTNIGKFLGEISISGESNPLYMFADGLYDRGFAKILNFPFRSNIPAFIGHDSLGNVTDLALNSIHRTFLGRIAKRSTIALASAFYHNNQLYILMLLSGLLVGLMATNIFRRRAKRNLDTIAKQNTELEQAHHDLKEAQQKVIAAEKYKQAKDIAGGFAHEIRNALFPADGLLGKLRRFDDLSKVDPDRLKNYLKDSQKAVNRAVDITELISQYTKLDSEHMPEPVHLRKLLDEIVDANKMRLQEQGVSIEITCPAGVDVIANHKQLYMVFNNIVLNALDALEKQAEPTILISVNTAGTAAKVTITDNGTGIPDDEVDRVFETFYSTKPDRGTGLGLALARKIVEMYDGDIAVESKQNQGTTFTVKIPTQN